MNDPVADYLTKYGKLEKDHPADPVADYLTKYGKMGNGPTEKKRRTLISKREQARDDALRALGNSVVGQLKDAGQSLKEQAKTAINDPMEAAKGVALGLYHSVNEPLQTLGKGLRYPFTRKEEDVVSPEEAAKAVLMGTSLFAAGPAGKLAAEAAAPAAKIASGALTRFGPKVAGAVAKGVTAVAKHGAGGATFMLGADPEHPVKAIAEGAVIGNVLGPAFDAGGKAASIGVKATRPTLKTIGKAASYAPEATKRYIEKYRPEKPEGMKPPSPPAAVAPEGGVTIVRMPVDELVPDPERFQYKRGGDPKTGAGGELKDVKKFDEMLAGVISVWTDPETGITHPVNGHNRRELAKATGHQYINVQILPAKTAAEARALGALANIAEGRGTAIDAAQFFRDSGLGISDLRDRVSFKGPIAKNGIALSKLAPDVFGRVVRGEISETIGAAVGDMLDNPALQRTAITAIEKSGKRLIDAEARLVARQVAEAGIEQVEQPWLFGTEKVDTSLYVPRAQLATAIQKRLSADKRLFGFVSKESRAEGLARAGNVIDVEGSQRIATESGQLEQVFNLLATRSGPIVDALTQGAREIANGAKQSEVTERLYPIIREAVQETIAGRKGAGDSVPATRNPNEQLEAGGQPADDGGLGEGRVRDSTDPNQSVFLSPDPLGTTTLGAPRNDLAGRGGGAVRRSGDAELEAEGRGADGPLFDPPQEGPDLFGNVREPNDAGQGSLLDERAGTPASRSLSAAERHAESEVVRLRQRLGMETDPIKRVRIAQEIAGHERLINRDRKISSEEMEARAISESLNDGEVGGPIPEQGALLSPAEADPVAPASPAAEKAPSLGGRIRKRFGISNREEVVALRKISLNMARALDTPIREGRGNLKLSRALGAFWSRSEMIRVRRLKNVATVSHEIGHFLSKKYSLKDLLKLLPRTEREEMWQELLAMGKELYGTRKPRGGYAEEGVAQFFKFYVTDPARMLRDAPNFSRYMTALLEDEPFLRGIIDKARDDFARYEASPANAKIASMIVSEPDSRFANMSMDKLVDQWFNDLSPLNRATKKLLGKVDDITEDAGRLAELTKGNTGRARDMVDRGVVKWGTTQRKTRGLRDILKDVGARNRQAFTEYIVARQVLTKSDQGIDTGFDVLAAREVVARESGNALFAKAANEIWEFRSALLDYLQGAGLYLPSEVAAIRRGNPTPTPFYRYFEPGENAQMSGRAKSLAKSSPGVFRMKGSDRPILDPLQSIISDAYDLVDRAHRHHAAVTLVNAAINTEGGARIAVLLPEVPKELRQINVERIRDQLVDAGWLPPEEMGNAPTEGPGDLMMLEAWYEKRSAGPGEVRDNVMPVLIDGKRKWVQINDKPAWDAIQGMSVPAMDPLWRALSMPTQWLRLGATSANPDFALVNPFRDAFQASIYSEGPTRPPFYHLGLGLFHLLKERVAHGDDRIVQRWAQSGGENAGMVGADRRALTIRYEATVKDMMASPASKIKDLITHPVSAPFKIMRYVSEMYENANRVGVFKDVYQSRLREGMPEGQAALEAGHSSRNATQDFFKSGSLARRANVMIPFFAPRLGEIYKLANEFKFTNLATEAGRKRYATITLRAAASITVPSIMLYLMQKDDEVYQEIPEWLKANAWVVVADSGPFALTTKTGKTTRIWVFPRPHLLGYIFGYMPEKLLAAVNADDPDALTDLARQSWAALAPTAVPAFAGPFIENYANRSLFSGRPIVPGNTENLLPVAQAAPYTGETARLLSSGMDKIGLGYSPAKVENVVRGYTGGAGMLVKSGIDAIVRGGRSAMELPPLRGTPATAEDPLDRAPVIGRFITSLPGSNSKSVERLFREFDDAEQARLTYHRYLKEGRKAEADDLFRDSGDKIMSVAIMEDVGKGKHPGKLRVVKKVMSDITAKRREVAASNATPSQKAAMERQLEDLMVTIARSYFRAPQAR